MDYTLLVFGHGGARYALEVSAVREIVWLPELSPVEELPPYVSGVFNLRGRVVPVMDLGMRFGRARERYRISDRIVVIERNDARVGFVVNELHDVLALSDSAIEPARNYQGAGGSAQFVHGEAKLEDGLVMLLDVEALLQGAPTAPETLAAGAEPASPAEAQHADEARILRERARELAREPVSGERPGATAYAVVGLKRRSFAGSRISVTSHRFRALRRISSAT
ncbi:MAG: purine-binding chemotaxis protein CheW [Betaproteobacteria bacterium]|nr:purine-binding chemotaxis protein CheW [Betaproteobacteria bacterium]